MVDDEMENDSELCGFNGRILRVDLSSDAIAVEPISRQFLQNHLGGRGFIVHTLLSEVSPGIDPLGPENKLIFALGPVSGYPLAGCGRNSVGAKSPLTDAYGESEVGGYWGAELKRAGFDAIIIQGAAERPVYLWINDGHAELRDAQSLWGLEVAQTEQAIHTELGDNRIRTAVIGPAGENLVRFASIINDRSHAAGRTGMGAVMGSKRLKAVAVRGSQLPPAADDETLRDLGRWMSRHYRERTSLWQYGTGADVEGYSLIGNLPTRNFRDGLFEGAEAFSARTICESFGEGMESCYACAIRCKKSVRIGEPWLVEPDYGGPEYETLAAFGSDCMINDPRAISKAHDLCNRYGMDTISAGCTIAFAMECFENGLITPDQTGGLELVFGDASAMLQAVEWIARRESIGDLLAEGSRRAAARLGRGAQAYAMEVKGLEIPMHEPRLKKGLGLHYSVHGTGADHCTVFHDTGFQSETFDMANWREIDAAAEPIPTTELGARKVRMIYRTGLWRQLVNSLVLCLFVPYQFSQIRDMVSAVTGRPWSFEELMDVAERGMTLIRLFNLREGLSAADDRLPERFASPPLKGALKEQQEAIDPAELREAQRLYYQLLGWDEEGRPTAERLAKLGMEWASKYLAN